LLQCANATWRQARLAATLLVAHTARIWMVERNSFTIVEANADPMLGIVNRTADALLAATAHAVYSTTAVREMTQLRVALESCCDTTLRATSQLQ
jgi:hypothetical protein